MADRGVQEAAHHLHPEPAERVVRLFGKTGAGREPDIPVQARIATAAAPSCRSARRFCHEGLNPHLEGCHRARSRATPQPAGASESEQMGILRGIVPAAMLFGLTVQAVAQELPVLGQGNVSCSSWLDRRAAAAAEADTMTAWVLGYLTAFNQYASDARPDVSGGQEPDELTRWLDEYCRENATANLYQASVALVEELRQSPPQ